MSFSRLLLLLAFLSAPLLAAPRIDVSSEALNATARAAVARNAVRIGSEIPIPVASAGGSIHQSNPVIASNGESFLLVWRESTACCFWIYYGGNYSQSEGSLYAAAINSRGEWLGGPTLLSESAGIGVPGVAFDGTSYVVVWSDLSSFGSDIRFRRLAIDATPVDSSPLHIASVFDREMTIAVACGADDCLTLFNGGSALLARDGGVQRLYGAGGVRNAVVPTETGYTATITIRNVWTPGTVTPPAPPTDENNISRFSREGTLAGPHEFGYFRGYADERIGASLATNGSSSLIAAVDTNQEHPRLQPPLYVTLVPSQISSVPFTPRFHVDIGMIDGRQPSIHDPRIIWTGKRFFLIYQRTNEAFGGSLNRQSATKADIWGVFIEPDGSAVSGTPFELTSTDEFEALPSIAVNARGLMALAFVRGTVEDDPAPFRLYVKMLSDAPGRGRPVRR